LSSNVHLAELKRHECPRAGARQGVSGVGEDSRRQACGACRSSCQCRSWYATEES